jgi:truncated hemoglobin YjbI
MPAISKPRFVVVCSAALALWMYRWWRKTLSQPSGKLGLRDASEGVYRTFQNGKNEPAWWLKGQRLDFKMLFDRLRESGIREISTEFYRRVYEDDEAPWFRDMFRRRATLQQSIDRQAAFFTQLWGGPKLYTANNKPHCLRSFVKDHAGLKFFAMHENVRAKNEITVEGAERWFYHMDATLLHLRPSWESRFGKEDAGMIEKTIRWFADHGLGNILQGGPVASPWHPARIGFRALMRITASFSVRDLNCASLPSENGRKAA